MRDNQAVNTTPEKTRMNIKSIIYILLFTGILLAQSELTAQEKPGYTLPDDPTKAWAEVGKVHQGLRPPGEWRTHEPTADQVAEFQGLSHIRLASHWTFASPHWMDARWI